MRGDRILSIYTIRGKEMNRKECLKEAEKAVLTDREADYGAPEDTFAQIANLWATYLYTDITPKDVANMMILLKIARAANGNKNDNYIDIAGYAACAAEIGNIHNVSQK